MQKLIEKIHWIVFMYALFLGYDMYSVHQESMFNLNTRISVMNSNIIKARKKVSDLKKYFKDIEEAKRNIELVALEVEKVQRRLPADIADSENIKLIEDISQRLNIKSVSIRPEQEISKGFYFIKNYMVSGEATYLQFLVLFEKISESKRLLNIKSVKFDLIADRVQRARFKLIKGMVTVQTYRYNNQFRESRGINKIESEFKNTKRKKRRKGKK